MNTKDKIKVMQAWVDGEDVYFAHKGYNSSGTLLPKDKEPKWAWDITDYTIKKDTLVRWINLYVVKGLNNDVYSDSFNSEEDAKNYVEKLAKHLNVHRSYIKIAHKIEITLNDDGTVPSLLD